MRIPNFEILLLKDQEDPNISHLVLSFSWSDASQEPLNDAWFHDQSSLFDLKWDKKASNLVLSIPDVLSDGSSSIIFPFFKPSHPPLNPHPSDNTEEEFLNLQLLEQATKQDNPENLVLASVMRSMIKDHQGLYVVPFDDKGDPLAQLSFKAP